MTNIIIFFLSALLLCLQIVLLSLLRVYLKLPFMAISFAFLGLSFAGVVSYLFFNKQSNESVFRWLSISLDLLGLLLFIYFTVIFKDSVFHFSQFRHASSGSLYVQQLDQLLKALFSTSCYVGIYFSVCFFLFGLAISLIYRHFSQNAPRLYLFDLCGAAFGCILGTLLIIYVKFSSIPLFLALLCFFMSYLIKIHAQRQKRLNIKSLAFMLLTIFFIIFNGLTGAFDIKLGSYFLLPNYEDYIIHEETWSAWNAYSHVALVQLKKKKSDPYTHVFTIDYGSGNAFLRPFKPDDPYHLKLSDGFTGASLGFLRGVPKDILIIFAGAGTDMIESYSYSKGQADITGIELNPLIVKKALSMPEFHLNTFLNKDNVRLFVQEGRSFLESTDKKYDSILFSWSGAGMVNYLGTAAYTGQYLYTHEAFISLINLLTDDGTISILNENKLKLLAMFNKAFRELGYDDISKNVVVLSYKELIKNGQLQQSALSPSDKFLLMVKKTPFTKAELQTVSKNTKLLNLELIYTPSYTHDEYSYIEEIIRTKQPEKYMKAFGDKHSLSVIGATDNKPFSSNIFYINNIFKKVFWTDIKSKKYTKYSFYNLTHVKTISMIFFLMMMGFVFVFLPLIFKRRQINLSKDLPFLYYFSVLGISFILVEISILNQFVLFLGNPMYSFSVILAGLLISTGLGSHFSSYFFDKKILNIKKVAVLAFLLLLVYAMVLPRMIQSLLGLLLFVKFMIAFTIILPLGLILGMLFPQGLKKLDSINQHLIPWAWGMNGYMSVIGSAVCVYLPIVLGFNSFILIAAVLYLSIALFPDRGLFS
ncbi:MAG: hypothetical protein K8S27_05975 [Candidatus Omnitrophica bacterium]|nr:hypothetical protein [Candidatus Omnitrophota bacterium]